MHFVSLIRWWYGAGWLDQLRLVQKRFDRAADFFSLELALRTFFAPFRQIDAEGARKGSLGTILRAWFDQLSSRFIGSMARGFLIVLGSVAIALEGLVGLLRLAVWPLVPFLPLVSVPLMTTGWMPWR